MFHRLINKSAFPYVMTIVFFAIINVTYSYDDVPVPSIQCGDVVEGELTASTDAIQKYVLNVAPGATLNIQVEPIGSTLAVQLLLLDSSGKQLIKVDEGDKGKAEKINGFVISSRNPYVVIEGRNNWGDRFLGAYTLSVGCILRDNTIINPGEATPLNNTAVNSSNLATFSGNGFPGLAPVDFSAVAKIPTVANVPMTGGVAPTGDTILGYTLDASANDTLALNFTRLSGNLNLGLVVLSADNKVVFQASLVTSSELTTKFTLPTAGTYTIGIFRIDLLPPDAPEATAFQLTATLNP